MGYVLKWELEAGLPRYCAVVYSTILYCTVLPRGCQVFKNKKGEDMTHDEFRWRNRQYFTTIK